MTDNSVTSYKSGLAKINDVFVPMITDQLVQNGVSMTQYQKQCVINAINSINSMAMAKGKTATDYDTNNLTEILLNVAALQLNASATPNEVYFIERRKKIGDNDYKVMIEMGIEGDGNDAILSRFGRNVAKVHKHWVVRENDEFIYPRYRGLEYTPPEWQPRGTGRVVKVVYPVQFEDGSLEYYIGERADVKRNLLGHISQNLMWDKKGTKAKIFEMAKDMSVDEMLENEEIVKLGNISKAWCEPQAKEQMIERKIRNNIVKKIPKDFSTSFEAERYKNEDDIVKSMKIVDDISETQKNIDVVNFDEVEYKTTQDDLEVVTKETMASDEHLIVNEEQKEEKTEKSEPQADIFEEMPDFLS